MMMKMIVMVMIAMQFLIITGSDDVECVEVQVLGIYKKQCSYQSNCRLWTGKTMTKTMAGRGW